MAQFREAGSQDTQVIAEIWKAVVNAGAGVAGAVVQSVPQMLRLVSAQRHVELAEWNDVPAGVLLIRARNQYDGRHVAVAQVWVAPEYRRRGIGTMLAVRALRTAKSLDFSGVLIEDVLESNQPAIQLGGKLGFESTGRIPGGSRTDEGVLTDVLCLYKKL